MPSGALLWHDRHVSPTSSSREEGSGSRRAARRAEPESSTPRRARRRASAVDVSDEPDEEATESADGAEVEPIPVRRLVSLAVAGFAGLLGVALVFGAQTAGVGAARAPYGFVIFGVQAIFVISWTICFRPPSARVVAVVGLLTAATADVAAIYPAKASIAGIGFAAVAGFILGVIGQMVREAGRMRVAESLGASMIVVVAVVSFATLIVLTRITVGTQAIVVSLTATAVSLVVARVTDAIMPYPRLAPQVPRGSSGVVIGAMMGSVTGAVLGSLIEGFDPRTGAVVGFVAAFAAVLADLAIGYAEASREVPDEPGPLSLVRHLQGPLAGFALAAPAAYVISVLYLVPHLAGG